MAGGNSATVGRAVEAPDLRRHAAVEPELPLVPPGCPITPLGVQGLKVWLLDYHQQLINFDPECRKGALSMVFGGDGWLLEHFPQFSAAEAKAASEGKAVTASKFDQADVQSSLIRWCVLQGIFDPAGRVFGRGAHRVGEDDDQLVMHLGDRVTIANAEDKKGKKIVGLIEHQAGKIDGKFFPALQPLPAPADKASTREDAQALLALFGKWYWQEPHASPLLLLGMVGQMFICGALKWRSHAWLAGPTAAGKSSLQALIRAILSNWCLHTEDASEAAIRQVLDNDTLPVLIDEAEGDDNPERQRAMLNLMKKASSGSKIHRGSQDHKARDFTAQSCFLLSSVLHSLSKGEEWNRVAVLMMKMIPEDAPMWDGPELKHWRVTGRKMHRRMIEQWPRFARTLSDYKRAIHDQGFQGRTQDTYGTLLACADCLMYDAAPSEGEGGYEGPGFIRAKAWVAGMVPLMHRAKTQARTDIERCIAHLMSAQIPGANGSAAENIGTWIVRGMTVVPGEGGNDEVNRAARERLKQFGLKLILPERTASGKGWASGREPPPTEDGWKNGYLAVAYPTCGPLVGLFKGANEWAGGGYLQSLGKIEGAITSQLKVRFGGLNPDNAIAIPLLALRGEE